MDAETKAYFDGMFAEVLTAMNAGFSRLERRRERFGTRVRDRDCMDRRLSALDERPERRFQAIEERLDRVARRLEEVEKHVLGVHGRVDDLASDMRPRFRVLNDRVGGLVA